MHRELLFEDFEGVSKTAWLEMLAGDADAVMLREKLNWQAGDITAPAYVTREDWDQVRQNAAPPVRWQYPHACRIAEPFLLSSENQHIEALIEEALAAGAEALWLESEAALSHHNLPGKLPMSLVHCSGPGFTGPDGARLLDGLLIKPASLSIFTDANISRSPDLISHLAGNIPCRTISISLAGSSLEHSNTAADLSRVLQSFNAYATQFRLLGLPVSDLFQHVQFVIPLQTSFYLEMGRIRALRMLLSRLIMALMPDFCDTIKIPFIADTSPGVYDEKELYTNLLRGATKAMSAMLSGCSLLIVRPFVGPAHPDYPLARRMARNTQLILKHESHLQRVVDPGAGSFYLENITHLLANEAWRQFSATQALPL